jgi:hypothetical protein
MEYDDFDFDSGVEWFKTDEHYRCGYCGHVGPAEAKAEQETQGDGLMTGTVTLATGELRCAECESTDLHEIPSSIVDAVKALVSETLYEGGDKANGIAVRFLARMTILKATVGLEVPTAMRDEALVLVHRQSSEVS